MTTALVFHEVKDGEAWANAWRKRPGSRHELFARIGVSARVFRDPNNANLTGLLLEIPDMNAFQAVLASADGKKAMQEDGLRVETMRTLVEFSP